MTKIMVYLKIFNNRFKKYIGFLITIAVFGFLSRNIYIFARNIYVSRPVQIEDPLLNPYMGYAASARTVSTRRDVTLVFALVPWNQLERQEGYFDFYAFEEENNFEKWREKDAKIILRPVMDVPSKDGGMGIPKWLYHKIEGDGTHYDNEYGKGFSPNYENEILIEYHRRFINALGERYDDDDFVAFVQLGSIGHWGEWHVNSRSGIQQLPTADVLEQYFNHYLRAFPNTLLLMRRPLDFAYAYNVGLYNDMIGHEVATDRWLLWIQEGYVSSQTGEEFKGNPDFWKTAPSGGEVFEGSAGLRIAFSDESIGTTISQIEAAHTSWIGPNAPVHISYEDEMSANIDKALATMGYRFRVTNSVNTHRVMPGQEVNVRTTWVNEGVAPFYYKWNVELLLISGHDEIVYRTTTEDDIRTWLPGETIISEHTFVVPTYIPPGVYTLAVRIFEGNEREQIIKLAQQGDIRNSEDEIIMYAIGEIIVTN